jgi:hypothetical protein
MRSQPLHINGFGLLLVRISKSDWIRIQLDSWIRIPQTAQNKIEKMKISCFEKLALSSILDCWSQKPEPNQIRNSNLINLNPKH